MGKSIFDKLIGTQAEKEEKSPKEIEKEKKENNPLIQKESFDPKFGEKRHELIIESMMGGVEKYYFQVLRTMRQSGKHGLGYDEVLKIRDVFDASVGSSFHGALGSKLAQIQQQASQYLAQIGQMIKAIFPQVRELRILDERLQHYTESMDDDNEIAQEAEIALKSVWIEVVEQGMQNPNSVYALATKLGFVTLPDLFFDIRVKDKKDIHKVIKSMEKEGTVPNKVRDVLAKKLYQYYTWKENTYKELTHRRKFMISNLKQHYNVIKMYASWLRPYLKNIRALQMKAGMGEGYSDADLVNAFETSKMQLELLGVNKKGYKKYYPCVLVKFKYVTLPELHYAEGGQRKPIHVGRTEMYTEAYVLTDEQIKQYLDHEWEEDLKMIPDIHEALDSLGDDLMQYLKEAEGSEEEKPKEDKKKPKTNYFEPFTALGGGFKDIAGIFELPSVFKTKEEKKEKKYSDEKEKAKDEATTMAWVVYLVMKKMNNFLST